jgi:hypothetical protein
MSNTVSETAAQVTPKPRNNNRVQYRLDQVEKALREVVTAIQAFDAELDELSGLMSEDVDELIGDLRGEASEGLRVLGVGLENLRRGIEAAADADGSAA